MDTINVAVVQMDSQEDYKKNLEMIQKYLMEAAKKGAQMVFFPENVDYIGDDYAENAKKTWKDVDDFLSSLARQYSVYVHCGSITEYQEGKKPFNTSILYSPTGKKIARYSKIHMFDVNIEEGPFYKESDETEAGNEIVIAKTKLANIGFSICYDMRFPEIYKLMALNGAQIITVPANFTLNTGKDHWESLLRARAIENTCFVIAPGQIGVKKCFQAYGKSMIVDPWGNVIARSSDRPGVILTEIDLDMIDEVRTQIPSLTNIRKDVYELSSRHIKIYEE